MFGRLPQEVGIFKRLAALISCSLPCLTIISGEIVILIKKRTRHLFWHTPKRIDSILTIEKSGKQNKKIKNIPKSKKNRRVQDLNLCGRNHMISIIFITEKFESYPLTTNKVSTSFRSRIWERFTSGNSTFNLENSLFGYIQVLAYS
jgi:hypothetical protein